MQLWLIWLYFNSTNINEIFHTKGAISHEPSIFSRTYCADTYLSWIEMVAMLAHGNQRVSLAAKKCPSFYSFLCTFLLRQQTYIVFKPSYLRGKAFSTEIWVSKWCWQHLIASHALMLHSCNQSSECNLLHNMHTVFVLCVWCLKGEGWGSCSGLGFFGLIVGWNGHLVFSTGFAGEGRLCPSATVTGHIWMEAHLCAANSCNQD